MTSISLSPTTFDGVDLPDLQQQSASIRDCIQEEDVALLRGWISRAAVDGAMDRLRSGFSLENDTKLDHKSRVTDPRDIPNYQRLMLGEFGATETERSFFVRMFYNPLWNGDQWGLHDTFRRMIRLRNALYDVAPDHCLEAPQNSTYTLSRVHQYPRGGGFLAAHRDTVAAGVPESTGLNGYIQVLLVMSEKGRDFHTGGGYYVKHGERILYEEFTQPGDVLVYNGQTLHGVETVDPQEETNLASAHGRYSATVTLYQPRRGVMKMG